MQGRQASFVRKWLTNHVVTVFVGLPNLLINFGTQTILDVGFHWTGWYAPLAYLIGTSFSIEYTVIFDMLTKTNLTVLGRTYHFDHKERKHVD